MDVKLRKVVDVVEAVEVFEEAFCDTLFDLGIVTSTTEERDVR